ncbi:hypothetical protein [Erythrobacter dokdonensis]|uniref:PH domain-containing protein n=1 Tax=Erythrobacter dokdonensis DSW-74 TaxID=1300349 RepID=A0A1A7BLQ0_9SPHN|nr:hypothetical protein [Erythrobacter dokdonensis]OBV12656.1 hypothetical protein I603_0787 [Erythrobacter dokdonensis DSW-74]
MSAKVVIIRMRWWGHMLNIFALLFVAPLGLVIGSAGIAQLNEPGSWWKAPILMASGGTFLLAAVLLLNTLFTYRLEIDSRSLRLIGNLWTHDISWQEITCIAKHPNPKGFGYHVLIEVDGSRLPRRHWHRLWVAGYQIPTPMGKGPTELTAYLNRKRRDYLRRVQAAPAGIDA